MMIFPFTPIGSLININPTAPTLLIDAGANADCRPSYLVQFAQLGTIYTREIFGISSPRVGLLNNGEEGTKGNRLAKESYHLLKKTELNFIGNIEGKDIPKETADIVVTDGFTGNIVLKTIEGLGDTFLKTRQVGKVLSEAYREYGGACLLGVNGNIIIAHGRSQAKAIKNAIASAKQTVERGVCQKIKEEKYE